MSSAPTMTRRPRKRQASKRAKPVMLFNKRLRVGKPVALGGGLFAELQVRDEYVSVTKRWRVTSYGIVVTLRMVGAGDLTVLVCAWREKAEVAVRECEVAMLRLASALRVAGAS